VTAIETSDLSAIKSAQQRTWSSGNFSVVATRLAWMRAALVDLASNGDVLRDGGSIAIPATYLERLGRRR
jgi:hypothetical protein